MKGSGLYFGLLALGFVLLAVAGLKLPPRFEWQDTYGHEDAQPLGCQVFDSVLTKMLPQTYHLTNRSLTSLSYSRKFSGNLLVHVSENELYSVNEKALLKLLKAGHNVCLAIPALPPDLSKALGMPERQQYFSIDLLKSQASSGVRGEIRWNAQPGQYPAETYSVFSSLCGNPVFGDEVTDTIPKSWKVLAVLHRPVPPNASEDYETETPVVFSRHFGKGRLVLCFTPMLLTNYGMLDGRTAEYVMRILSQLGQGQLTRTTAYCYQASNESDPSHATPLGYFLNNAPLRWALFLTVFTLLLFMLFTARRRQRPMPLLSKPVNRELEFVKHIGSLHAERRDYRGLIEKQFSYFAEQLLHEQQIDIRDVAADGDSFSRLSSLTGKPVNELATFVRAVRNMTANNSMMVTSQTMKIYIDKMEELKRILENR